MAAGNWHWIPGAIEEILKGAVDLENDTLVAVLLDETHTPAPTTDAVLADIAAEEIADAGYARQTLTGVSVTRSAGEIRVNWSNIDFGDAVTIEGKYCYVFDDTHASDRLIAFADLNTDSTSATVASTADDFDITTGAVNELTITPTAYSAGN